MLLADLEIIDLRRAAKGPKTHRPLRTKSDAQVIHHLDTADPSNKVMRKLFERIGIENHERANSFEHAIAFFRQTADGVMTVTRRWDDVLVKEWREGGIPRAHKDRAFVGYHFLIDGLGRIAETLDRYAVGAHAGQQMNRRSYGICLLGTFKRRPPSQHQMHSLRRLVIALARTGARSVYGHDEVRDIAKGCPGLKVDVAELRGLALEA